MAHRAVERRRLDIPLAGDEAPATLALSIAAGVALALVFLVVIPALGLVLGAAVGIDMGTAP